MIREFKLIAAVGCIAIASHSSWEGWWQWNVGWALLAIGYLTLRGMVRA